MKSILILSILFLISCNSHFKNPVPKQIDTDEWTLEHSPNNLDVVGVVFGIDKKGMMQRVPGGKLEIKTTQSPIVLSESKNTKNVSYGALLNFMNLNNYIDSTSSIDFADSTKIESAFTIKNGTITNIADDISSAFLKQKQSIESNMSILDMDSTKFFLVLETIQSPNVDISFSKAKSTKFQTFSKLQKLFNLNTNIHVNKGNDNSLTYELQEPLVVFYKLRKLNVAVSRIKGSPNKKVELSLGDIIASSEVPLK